MQENNGKTPWLLLVLLPVITWNPFEYHVWYFVQWFWANADAADYVRSFTDLPVEKLLAVAIAVFWILLLRLVGESLFKWQQWKTVNLVLLSYVPLLAVALHYEMIDFSDRRTFHMSILVGISWAIAVSLMRIAVRSKLGIVTVQQQ